MSEEFEKWARDKGYPFCEVVPAHGPASAMATVEYRYSEMARAAWQASRKQALEEAAMACDRINDAEWHAFKKASPDDARRGSTYTEGKSAGAEDCAEQIRAII